MAIGTATWWLVLNLISIAILAFFSMQEMACVSFNRIRLHYYVNKGMKRAIWLNELLQHPGRLFGTTLLGVNAAMFVGSECSREFYMALGLSPDLAPLTQVAIVIIFAELAPMFAARRYAEHVAMAGIPILYLTTKVLAPLLWCLSLITKLADKLTAKTSQHHASIALNQEDLQRLLAAQDEDILGDTEGEDIDTFARNIFSLRHKDATQVMQPINSIPVLPATATIGQLRQLLQQTGVSYVPIYHRAITHIVGIAQPRDLIRIPDNRRIRDYTIPPWFITQNTQVMQILKEFRRNRKNVAIVLDSQGQAIGIITLDDLTEEIIGKSKELDATLPLIIDRTFSGDVKVSEFNAQYDVDLGVDPNLTLAELMTEELGHHPEVGETVHLSHFELTVKETSLTEIKRVTITTRL